MARRLNKAWLAVLCACSAGLSFYLVYIYLWLSSLTYWSVGWIFYLLGDVSSLYIWRFNCLIYYCIVTGVTAVVLLILAYLVVPALFPRLKRRIPYNTYLTYFFIAYAVPIAVFVPLFLLGVI